MMKFFKDFWQEEEAMGTIEIVIIIAVLVALAILFKEQLNKFANSLMDNAFDAEKGKDINMDEQH